MAFDLRYVGVGGRQGGKLPAAPYRVPFDKSVVKLFVLICPFDYVHGCGINGYGDWFTYAGKRHLARLTMISQQVIGESMFEVEMTDLIKQVLIQIILVSIFFIFRKINEKFDMRSEKRKAVRERRVELISREEKWLHYYLSSVNSQFLAGAVFFILSAALNLSTGLLGSNLGRSEEVFISFQAGMYSGAL